MKILIVKIGAIGDILMATPALRAIRKHFAGASITVMLGESCASTLEGNPHVDRLWVVDDRKLYQGGYFARLRLAVHWVWEIRRNGFDKVFVFHRDRRFNLLAYLGGVRERYGFDRNGEGRFLTAKFRAPEGLHHIDHYLSVAELAGVPQNGTRMEFPISPDARGWAEKVLTDCGAAEGQLIGLVPGGARNVREVMDTRRWPLERYDELMEALLRIPGVRLIILGARSDAFVIDGLKVNRPNVINLVGKTNLQQLAAVLAGCRAVITHDSGPMHLAAAVGVPVVALFGPTDPREKFPMNEGSSYFWKPEGLPCCPCYKDGRFPACPIDVECLRRIQAGEVAERVRAIMDRPVSPAPSPS